MFNNILINMYNVFGINLNTTMKNRKLIYVLYSGIRNRYKTEESFCCNKQKSLKYVNCQHYLELKSYF